MAITTPALTKKLLALTVGGASALSLSACGVDIPGVEVNFSAEETTNNDAEAETSPLAASESEASEPAKEETPSSSASNSSDTEVTPGGEKLSIGDTATVKAENHNGAVFTFDVTLTGIRDLPVDEVESKTGGPLEVSGQPGFVVDTYQCLDFEVTYRGMEGGDGNEYASIGDPSMSITSIDSNGLKANSLISSDEAEICGDGSLANLPYSVKDISEGETYYMAVMGFTDASERGKPTGAEFEYDLDSDPSLSGKKFTWS